MTTTRVLLALLVSTVAATAGCGALTDWACGRDDGDDGDDECDNIDPVEGTQDEFTAGPRDEDAFVVSSPAWCSDIADQPVHAVRVTTEGTEVESARDWLEDRVLEELREPGRPTPDLGVARCQDAEWVGDAAVFVHDWDRVDPVVDTVVDLAVQDGIGIDVIVFVEPMVVGCAQYQDCGY